jgi:hypothetical protein
MRHRVNVRCRLYFAKITVNKQPTNKGCDLILLNSGNNNKIKIEVKTSKVYTTSKNEKAAVQFTLTEAEYEACDF